MPSKTPRAAVGAVRDRLGTVAACVTERPVVGSGSIAALQPQEFSFRPVGLPAPLRTRRDDRRLLFRLAIGYAIEANAQGYTARETLYRYQLLDGNGREILAGEYHWHPTGVSPVTSPHLHLSGRLAPLDAGRGQAPVSLGGMHLPTGPVALADVVRLLVTEFGVEPRRADWDAVLHSNRDPFDLAG